MSFLAIENPSASFLVRGLLIGIVVFIIQFITFIPKQVQMSENKRSGNTKPNNVKDMLSGSNSSVRFSASHNGIRNFDKSNGAVDLNLSPQFPSTAEEELFMEPEEPEEIINGKMKVTRNESYWRQRPDTASNYAPHNTASTQDGLRLSFSSRRLSSRLSFKFSQPSDLNDASAILQIEEEDKEDERSGFIWNCPTPAY